MSKNFEQLFFQRFFRFFEVCTSGDLVDFLGVCSGGVLKGTSILYFFALKRILFFSSLNRDFRESCIDEWMGKKKEKQKGKRRRKKLRRQEKRERREERREKREEINKKDRKRKRNRKIN